MDYPDLPDCRMGPRWQKSSSIYILQEGITEWETVRFMYPVKGESNVISENPVQTI